MIRILFTILFTFISLSANADEKAFTLSSASFPNDGPLPTLYTCDGKDISPDLSWSNAPQKTQSFALTVTDPDAPGGNFYHWIVINIPHSINTLAENIATLPAGAISIKNSWNKPEYSGPCPPAGSMHHYVFTLYALDATLNLPKDTDVSMLLAMVKKHVLSQEKITAIYSRWH